MTSILSRAGCFLGIILLGCLFRRTGFFQEKDFHVISKIVLRFTLPAAIITSFSGKVMEAKMLILIALGFGYGVIYLLLAKIINRKREKKHRAFCMLNTTGFNIGTFTMPFAQSFLGAMGVVAVSFFDSGNALLCFGGAYCVASMEQDGTKFSVSQVLETVLKSVSFDAYILMMILCLLRIRLPDFVLDFAGILANANAFLAMLMIGVGLNLSCDKAQLHTIVKTLILRYSVALVLSIGSFLLLPLPLEFRQAVAICVFAPVTSTTPAYTGELGGDIGLSSAINSLTIVISLVCITALLVMIL